MEVMVGWAAIALGGHPTEVTGLLWAVAMGARGPAEKGVASFVAFETGSGADRLLASDFGSEQRRS